MLGKILLPVRATLTSARLLANIVLSGGANVPFQSVMKCDADIHENLCADIVLSSGGNVSFQSVTNYDAGTPANVLVSTDMSALPAEVVVAKTSIEESSHQWRFVRQCHVDKVHEHILQSATKCDADNRRNSHAIRWSFLSPSRGHVEL